MSLFDLPIVRRLAPAKRVLVSGAGGGFDIFSGLPLAFALRKLGKEVVLANLTFTYIGGTDAELIMPALSKVTEHTQGETKYFPERYLCQWFASRGEHESIYCFEKVGVAPLRAAYARVIKDEKIDAVVLIDGGTDILMRGVEAGLGTPQEDMTSLAAVAKLDVPIRIVSCLGFGIDAFHGVCDAQFLENVAALDVAGGYLGAHSHFGDHQRTDRTGASQLFINPLMTLYWHFELEAVAKRSLYLPLLEGTKTVFDVSAIIEGFRHEVAIRPRMPIPV